MTTREQLNHERLDALLSMIADDGAAGPGEVSVEHVEAVRRAASLDEPGRVAQSHAEGRGPPDDIGQGGP